MVMGTTKRGRSLGSASKEKAGASLDLGSMALFPNIFEYFPGRRRGRLDALQIFPVLFPRLPHLSLSALPSESNSPLLETTKTGPRRLSRVLSSSLSLIPYLGRLQSHSYYPNYTTTNELSLCHYHRAPRGSSSFPVFFGRRKSLFVASLSPGLPIAYRIIYLSSRTCTDLLYRIGNDPR